MSNRHPAGDLSRTMKGGFRCSGAVTGTCRIDTACRVSPSAYRDSTGRPICGGSIDQGF